MQHSGYAHVIGISKLAGKFGRQVDAFLRRADDFVIFDIFGADFRRDFHIPARARGGDLNVELFAADQLAIGNLSLRAVADHAVDDGQFFDRRVQLRGGEL